MKEFGKKEINKQDSAKTDSQPGADKTPLDLIVNNISQDFSHVKPLNKAADKLGVETGQLVLGIFLIFLILIIIGAQSTFVTAIIGFLYPAYMSMKALESQNKEDDKQWLTYWIVFGFLHVFDGIFSILSGLIPIIYPIKLIFLVWMFYPKTLGADILYRNVVKKVFLHLEQRVKEVYPE